MSENTRGEGKNAEQPESTGPSEVGTEESLGSDGAPDRNVEANVHDDGQVGGEGEDGEDGEEDGEEEDEDGSADDEPVDLDHRILCADGACIGIIGHDGHCKECGKPMDPADARAFKAIFGGATTAKVLGSIMSDDEGPGFAPVDDSTDAGSGSDKDSQHRHDEDRDADDDSLDEDSLENRQLCPDGACIGIIGPDGHCKECGRRADDVPVEG